MKKSKDWVRNPAFDKLLDAYVEQNGEFPADMLPNEIAGLLGLTANGEFYKKHRAWKRRREAAANLPAMDIPCEAKAELTNILAATTEDVLNHFVRTVRTVAGDIIRTADLGVADANRRAAEAEAELAEVLDAWTVTEGERDAAREELAEAVAEAAKLRREVDRLFGRLEERDDLRNGQAPGEDAASSEIAQVSGVASDTDKGPTPPEAPIVPADPAGTITTMGPGQSGTSNAEPKSAGPVGPDQSSINEADGQQVHQAELSLVKTENAGTAEADHDDND